MTNGVQADEDDPTSIEIPTGLPVDGLPTPLLRWIRYPGKSINAPSVFG